MKKLQEIRKLKGLTQQDLAKLSGITQQSISKYERGIRSPESESLKKLALALEVSADDLLGITEEVKKFKEIQKMLAFNLLGKTHE